MVPCCRRRFHGGFSLIELLVVMAIVAILAGILLPVVGLVRTQAHALRCVSQVRQCTLGILAYAGENEGFTPVGLDVASYVNNWGKALVDGNYLEVRTVLHCPTVRASANWWFETYGFSVRQNPVRISTLSGSASVLAVADSSRNYNATVESPTIHKTLTVWENDYACLRHARSGNASFFDGHCERLTATRFGEVGYSEVHRP